MELIITMQVRLSYLRLLFQNKSHHKENILRLDSHKGPQLSNMGSAFGPDNTEIQPRGSKESDMTGAT